MNKGKELTIKQIFKRQGKKVIVTYPYREDIIMTVEKDRLIDERGKFFVEENTDCRFYEYVE